MKLQTDVLDFLKLQPYTWATKVEEANEWGVPDILCCVNGYFLAIEIKSGKDKLRPSQKMQIPRIKAAQGPVWVIRDYDEFVKKWERWLMWIILWTSQITQMDESNN